MGLQRIKFWGPTRKDSLYDIQFVIYWKDQVTKHNQEAKPC